MQTWYYLIINIISSIVFAGRGSFQYKGRRGKKWNYFCDRAELSNLCENLKYQVVNIAEISAKLTTIKI